VHNPDFPTFRIPKANTLRHPRYGIIHSVHTPYYCYYKFSLNR